MGHVALGLTAKVLPEGTRTRDNRIAGELAVALMSGKFRVDIQCVLEYGPRNNRSAVKSISLDRTFRCN